MKDPIRIMLLGIAILIVSVFIQNMSLGGMDSPSNTVQIIFAIGLITTLAGFFYKK